MFRLDPWLLLPWLLVWGWSVVGDSPQLSTLSAQRAPREIVGSALSFATCVGFAITIAAIALLDQLKPYVGMRFLLVPLFAGPLVGGWFLSRTLQPWSTRH
jgi:hypothetical protein